jgi:hypothetical protein
MTIIQLAASYFFIFLGGMGFMGGPTAGRRRVGHGGPKLNPLPYGNGSNPTASHNTPSNKKRRSGKLNDCQ